jgi:hypothetical protein
MTNRSEAALLSNLDDAVTDGLVDICPDCGDVIDSVSQACHPYCVQMLGYDFEFPENF